MKATVMRNCNESLEHANVQYRMRRDARTAVRVGYFLLIGSKVNNILQNLFSKLHSYFKS